jgi:hypothetical protein
MWNGVPGKKNIALPQVTEKLDHIMLYRIHLPWARFELTTSVVIDTDCIGSCKSNYDTIMATTTPCRREGLHTNDRDTIFIDTKGRGEI